MSTVIEFFRIWSHVKNNWNIVKNIHVPWQNNDLSAPELRSLGQAGESLKTKP